MSKTKINYETTSNEDHEEEATGLLTGELPNQRLNLYLLAVCSVFVLSSFQFGYAIGVINTPQEAIQCQPPGSASKYSRFFKDCINMSSIQWSTAVAIFAIGGLLGGLTGGSIADLLGRKTFLWLNNFVFIVAIALQALFSNFYVFSIGRFLIGVGSGITTVVVPMYLSEIAPTKLRGAIGVLPQLLTTIGIFVSQVLGVFMSTRPVGWRLLLGWTAVLPAIQLVLLLFCPESPRWYLTKNREKEGRVALSQLRQSDNIATEMLQLTESGGESSSIRHLFDKRLIRPIIVAIGIHIFQQMSGVNAVFFYSTSIFQSAGIQNASVATAIVGVINVVSTLIAVPLMDIAGRRLLMIVGQIGEFIFFLILTLSFIFNSHAPTALGYLSVVCVIGYVISFAVSMGPVPWLMVGEIFPSSCRAYAVSIAVAVNWTCNFTVALTFPFINKALKQYTFFPFTGIIFLGIIFTIVLVPETKGKTIEEIVGFSDSKPVQNEEEETTY